MTLTKIIPEELTILPLDRVSFDRLQGFSCGNSLIDAYLFTDYYALFDHKNGVASTNVAIYDHRIAGFFTASCTQVKVREEDRSMGIHSLFVPAIEVKFLAVAQLFQRRGIGEIILKYIISQAYQFSTVFGCRYVFLWSVPEAGAMKLYSEHFFEDTGTANSDGSRLMMLQLPEDIDLEEY